MRVRRPTVILILVIVGAGLLAWLRRGYDTLEEPPQLVGHLWAAETSPTPVLVHLIEGRRRKNQRTGRHSLFSRTILYSRYILVVRRLSDGGVLAHETISEVQVNSGQPAPELLGLADGRAWIWQGELAAFSLPRLEKTFSSDSWGERAVEVADLLPATADGFRVLPDRRSLAFRGRDARIYRVNADAGDIEAISAELFPSTTLSQQIEDRFVHYQSPGKSRVFTSVSNLTQKGFPGPDGYWYLLLSKSERKGLPDWVQVDNRPYGEVPRTLYRVRFEWERPRDFVAGGQADRTRGVIDGEAAEAWGDLRLIQGGFLERNFYEVWQLPEPPSALALGRSRLGTDVPWELVRVGLDGKVLWRTSTELAELYEYLPTARAVVMIGQRLPTSMINEKSDRRQFVVTIDITTGARHEIDIADTRAAVQIEADAPAR